MARALIRVSVLLALAAGLWLDVGWAANGGFAGLLQNDPLFSLREQRALAARPEKGPRTASSMLLFFGDSTCTCVKNGDAEDMAVPYLGFLVGKRLAGPERLLPAPWQVGLYCDSGSDGYRFESIARGLALNTRAAPPRAAVVVVNLRSLNRLGINGFPSTAGLLEDGDWDASGGASGGLWASLSDEVRFSPAASTLRSLAVWTRGALEEAITPAPLTGKQAAPRFADTPRGHYQMVYGEGFALDENELKALIRTGDTLKRLGCRTLYYLTPMDRRELARQMGPGVVRQLDAGAVRTAEELRGAGYPVLDLHAFLDAGFIEQPSEHLDAQGRLKVARRLSGWVAETLFPRGGGR